MKTRLLAFLLWLAAPVQAQEVRIKLGTLAPNGSTWHTLLKEMGQKWSEASNGQVKLIIYPGGVQGNEGDMVKKTRIGQLQAVALTTIGLHDITPEPWPDRVLAPRTAKITPAGRCRRVARVCRLRAARGIRR